MISKQMVRKEMYSIEDVLSKITPKGTPHHQVRVEFDGDWIKMNSQRYELFAEKGITCCECGIQGQYFLKERFPHNETYHFNLYARDKDGKEVLMTKDHIIPRSKGGKNVLSNYQTMCYYCNVKKGNTI